MPDNKHPKYWPDYPQFDPKEYKAKLEAYLIRLFQDDRKDEIERISGFKVPNRDELDRIIEYLQGQVDLEGVNPRLPLYYEIMEAATTPEWRVKRGQAYLEGVRKWRAGIEEESQWERAFGLQEEKFAWQQEEAQRQWQWRQQQAEWERGEPERAWQESIWRSRSQAAIGELGAFTREEPTGEVPQREKARIWEATKQEMVSQLNPDRDWIQLEEWQQKENPYLDEREIEPAERVRKWEGELESAEQMWKRAKGMEKDAASDPHRQLTVGEEQYIHFARENLWRAREHLAESEMERQERYAETPDMGRVTPLSESRGEGRQERQERKYPWKFAKLPPSMPSWAAKMYGPEFRWGKWEKQVGRRLPEEFEMGAPSGQAWGRLLPSQRQQWMGMAEHYGKKPLDLLAQMRKMLPRQPQRGQRWAPARQMA